MSNTIAYFDITIANEPAGRLTFELFDDVVPKVRLFMHLWSPCLLPQQSSTVDIEDWGKCSGYHGSREY